MASLKRAAARMTRHLLIRTLTDPLRIWRFAPRMVSVSMAAVMTQTQEAETANEKGSLGRVDATSD